MKIYYVVQYILVMHITTNWLILDFANNIHEKLKLGAQCINGEDKIHGGLVTICNQLTTNIGVE
jgi:hypothetical protein